MSEPGDRSPAFFIEPGMCWALVCDRDLQSDHHRLEPREWRDDPNAGRMARGVER